MFPAFRFRVRDSRHGTFRTRHRPQPLRKRIPPRSRDLEPLFRSGHSDVEQLQVLLRRRLRIIDLAEAEEDHGAELEAFAALHGQDVDLVFPRVVGPLAAAVGQS